MRLEDVNDNWDMVIIGGGITGAGILREAVRNNINVLLVEQKDFAWGTSSRSSKLVHGGLRYLKQGQLHLTIESVNERERLLKEAEGLVEPLDFLMPIYSSIGPGKWAMKTGLTLYDLMARKIRHTFMGKKRIIHLEPNILKENLQGGFQYMDAQVDDARLVMRLIAESVELGGAALNYTVAKTIIRNKHQRVTGVRLYDAESGISKVLSAKVVINATGAWAETLHTSPDKHMQLRPLRGSHLIFPESVFPVKRPVCFFHPDDQRPVFVAPWEGCVLLGTTDLDHDENLCMEPVISKAETDYLLKAARFMFPNFSPDRTDIISTIAGIRPVYCKGKKDASSESREHVVWVDKGLVTITGGKLTTFRQLAWDTLKKAVIFLDNKPLTGRKEPVFSTFSKNGMGEELPAALKYRLYGRYGKKAEQLIAEADKDTLKEIPGTPFLWAELAHAAKYESVQHLTDLLLRRVRIGLILPKGGIDYLKTVKAICFDHMAWDNARWDKECNAYMDYWQRYHSVPTD